METEELITKISQIVPRADGSEVRIVATAMYGLGLTRSIDVYVHRRASAEDDWVLCSDRPHPRWRTMSREEYLSHGRSEMLRTVTHAEILKVTSMIGQPMSRLN